MCACKERSCLTYRTFCAGLSDQDQYTIWAEKFAAKTASFLETINDVHEAELIYRGPIYPYIPAFESQVTQEHINYIHTTFWGHICGPPTRLHEWFYHRLTEMVMARNDNGDPCIMVRVKTYDDHEHKILKKNDEKGDPNDEKRKKDPRYNEVMTITINENSGDQLRELFEWDTATSLGSASEIRKKLVERAQQLGIDEEKMTADKRKKIMIAMDPKPLFPS
eukprot:SAG11_NODE_3548_length_2377_cov_1.137840_1_plen_221_part_10